MRRWTGFFAILMAVLIFGSAAFAEAPQTPVDQAVLDAADADTALANGEAAYNEKDYAAAKIWLEKASELGAERANKWLGYIYFNGFGMDAPDYAKAAEHLAACGEDADAMNTLAWLYTEGRGVDKDLEKAAELYEKSAEAGVADSWVRLGYMYQINDDIEHDYPKALEYYKKAVALGSAEGCHRMGEIYEKHTEEDGHLERAAYWYLTGAAMGNGPCMYHMGNFYREGTAGVKNCELAVRYYTDAAENLNPNYNASALKQTYSALGKMLVDGEGGIEKDMALGAQYYEKAAEMDDLFACEMLGWLYCSDVEGFEADYAKGVGYYLKACELGSGYANEMLGRMHLEGKYFEANEDTARAYLEKAQEAGQDVTELLESLKTEE